MMKILPSPASGLNCEDTIGCEGEDRRRRNENQILNASAEVLRGCVPEVECAVDDAEFWSDWFIPRHRLTNTLHSLREIIHGDFE